VQTKHSPADVRAGGLDEVSSDKALVCVGDRDTVPRPG